VNAGGAGRAASLLLTVSLLAFAGRARAAPSPSDLARAEGLYRQALAHVEHQAYDRALPLLEEGYRLSQLPGFLFNLGQVHRLRGNCAEAVLHYRAFLGADAAGPERADAEYHIGALEPCPAQATRLKTAPAPAPTPTKPATAPTKGAVSPTTAATAPTPAATAPPLAPRPIDRRPDQVAASTTAASKPILTRRMAALASFAAGLAAAAGGVHYALQARAAQRRVEAFYREARSAPRPWDSDLAAVEASGRRASRRTLLLGVAAGGLLLGGATLALIARREGPTPSAHLTWAGRF
jgi:hypothetical protein